MSTRIKAGKIIEWLIVSLLLVGLWPLCGDAEDGQLTVFHGGDYFSEVLLSNGLLAGVGSRASALGGTCTGLQYGVEDLCWNPGRLGFIQRPEAMVDVIAPFISLNASSLMDLNGEAAGAVDDLVDEMGSDDLVLSPGDYPNVNATVSQKAMLYSSSLIFPLGQWGLGAGIHRPLSLELETMGAGLKACFAEELEEEPREEMTFSGSADLNLLLDIQINALSLGVGKKISRRWSLGLAADRYYGHISTNGRLQVEGLVAAAGHEDSFNDPNAEWLNQLHSEMVGSYEGACWAGRAGTSCRLRDNVSLDGTLVLPATLTLDGEMTIVQYSLPEGIDLDSDEPLDPDQVDPDEPTRTQMEQNPTADRVVIDVPGSFRLGAAWKVSFVTAILQYGHYFGDFSCSYRIEDGDGPVTYHLGLNPSETFTLGLDLKVVRLSGGFVVARSIYRREPEKEDQEAVENKIVVPTFALGTGLGLGGGYGIDLLLVSVPSGLMRITSTFQF